MDCSQAGKLAPAGITRANYEVPLHLWKETSQQLFPSLHCTAGSPPFQCYTHHTL